MEPDVVDADVATAVGHILDGVLRERVTAAAGIDDVFARDIAERVMRFTLGGGKRVRSQFLWWGLRACGGGRDAGAVESALRVAAGLELIQTCALVHDDVMDDSPLRRGRAAVHVELAAQYGKPAGREPSRHGARGGPDEPFGRAAAILAGDLALAWADDTLAEAPLAPDTRLRVRGIWRAMRTEMVAGQYLDLHGQATGSRSMVRAIRTACLKSALYSVERPIALGAALAGAGERTTRALCSAGRCAGIAFQLRDDLLGVFGDPEHTGKPSGHDIREGKPTYLVAVARARAEADGDGAALAVLDGALGDPGLSADGLRRVRAVLTGTGARALTQTKIDRLVAQSARHLAGAAVEPVAGRRLRALLSAVAGADPGPDRAASGPGHRSAAGAPDGLPVPLLLSAAAEGDR
ncbi:polyprenyl synthetase family protein [Streptomyces sp. F63]|nr:polyprenyl synthetase family protein [Streptomyces sp. F63]MBQ0985362.1 polyprenyl synthetase family protein [Streptomyces sp. F63]